MGLSAALPCLTATFCFFLPEERATTSFATYACAVLRYAWRHCQCPCRRRSSGSSSSNNNASSSSSSSSSAIDASWGRRESAASSFVLDEGQQQASSFAAAALTQQQLQQHEKETEDKRVVKDEVGLDPVKDESLSSPPAASPPLAADTPLLMATNAKADERAVPLLATAAVQPLAPAGRWRHNPQQQQQQQQQL